ncbi:MAG: hypothetical protein MUF34_15515, partial [Polyangiaceae bacterium]|nr:hypothetical protein [Polyangiaceae bacterium]
LLQNAASERNLDMGDDAWDDETLRDEIKRNAFRVHAPDAPATPAPPDAAAPPATPAATESKAAAPEHD